MFLNIKRKLLVAGLTVSVACASRATTRPSAVASPGAARWSPALVDTLTRLGREDQVGRDAIPRAVAAQDTPTILAFLRADTARSVWLRRVVRDHGWPTRSSVGDSAVIAAWLILQHSPFNDWQSEMLPILERSTAAGELSRSELAVFTDRVLVHQGKPQRYGSQFDVVNGRLVPPRVADLPGLDARRAEVGLPPMAEYVRMLADFYKLPVVWPPAP